MSGIRCTISLEGDGTRRTEENPADMLTEYLKAETIHKHMKQLYCRTLLTKSDTALSIQNIVNIKTWCQGLRGRNQ